jgi:hypothetical protein
VLPLFPELELLGVTSEGGEIRITVRNRGAATILTRTYGEPEYRLIAKLFDGAAETQDRWLSLPGDLAPGDEATLSFPRRAQGTTLRLYHAMQDIPMLEEPAWAEVTDVR